MLAMEASLEAHMTIALRRLFGFAVLGALVCSAGDRFLLAEPPARAQRIVSSWPQPSRLVARAMLEKHGQPQQRSAGALTWHGLYRGMRTVVHRSATKEGVVEQVVRYRVPEDKAAALAQFDGRLKIDRESAELSARTESVRTSFLILNLAHEIASGFREVADAQSFRDRHIRLANAGKSSRYQERLLFEESLPVLVPWGEETAPTGKPLEMP